MKILSTAIIFLLFILLYNSATYSLEDEPDYSTDISSDKMTYKGQDNLVIFSGSVHVVRSDFQLWSHELHVFLKNIQEDDSQGSQDNIEKILARGDVRIKSGGREGYSGLLTYHPDTGIARLEENPRLVENQNSVEGQTIILNMNDNTSEVLGGPDKRVRVIFHSDSKTQE